MKRLSLDNSLITQERKSNSINDDPEDGLFIRRGGMPFRVAAFFWDSFRTWHSSWARHIGFFHKRPEKVHQGDHAVRLLEGFCELMKMTVDTCYYRQPLNPTWAPTLGYYCYDLFRTIREGDRLHMTLHDLAAEVNPSLVANRGACYLCSMMRSFGAIIRSGVGNAWGHPMTWHGMASGGREGLFLVGLFRMALRQVDGVQISPRDVTRLKHCYELLMQLLYMAQAAAANRVTGGVTVGIQQFQREVECALDDASQNGEAFSLLGFGGKWIMKLRNLRDPQLLEEIMEKEKILIQQHADTITNDYSKHVEKGFIGDNSGTVNFNEAGPRSETATRQQEESAKKAKSAGANPPNREVQKIIRAILEENDDGFDAMGLFSELHARKAVIPEWVQNKPEVKSYISSFIGALRKEMEPEKRTISKSPYRIVPTDDA